MIARIERFKNLNQTNRLVRFIRIELSPIKLTWITQIFKLIDVLEKKYLTNFKLILLVCSDIQLDCFPKFVQIIKFDSFSSDWKMDLLDWSSILT